MSFAGSSPSPRARGPGTRARLDYPTASGIGDQERGEVRLIVIVLAGAALGGRGRLPGRGPGRGLTESCTAVIRAVSGWREAAAAARDSIVRSRTASHNRKAIARLADEMRACAVDLDVLRDKLVTYLDNELASLVTDTHGEAQPTAAPRRVKTRSAEQP